MNKNLKNTIKMAKRLQKKGLVYVEDNINLNVELNYQLLISIVQGIDLIMDVNEYEKVKDDKDKLLYQLALLTFNEKELISDVDIRFKKDIIRQYIDFEDPCIISDECLFIPNLIKLNELYDKALIQINEGKFPNMIFK